MNKFLYGLSLVWLIFLLSLFSMAAKGNGQGYDQNAELSKSNSDSFDFRKALSGTVIGLRGRSQTREAQGRDSTVRFQYQIKAKLKVELNDDGLSLNVQPQTGDENWASGWDDFAPISDESEFEQDIRIRRFFLQGQQSDHFTWQIGALPSRPSGNRSTHLSLDSDGWIDGARAMMQTQSTAVSNINITLGGLEKSSAHFYERSWDLKENKFVQVQIQGQIQANLDYHAEYNKIVDEEYLRAQLSWNFGELVALESTYLVVEELLALKEQDGDSIEGRSVSLIKQGKSLSGYKWKGQVAYVERYLSKNIASVVNGANLPEGDQMYFLLEQSAPNKRVRWANRVSKCVDNQSCLDDYRFDSMIRVTIR